MTNSFTFNAAGFTTAIICTIILVAEFICHRWVKKITKYYWFWLALGLFLTIWVIVFRMVPMINKYIDVLKDPEFSGEKYGWEISQAFNLDVCTFFGFFLPLTCVIDPSRKLARVAAPLALMGSIFVIYGQFTTVPFFKWGIKYILFGDGDLYAWMHIVNLFLGFGILLNTPKYGWKGYLSFLAVLVCFYTYVGIVMSVTGCNQHVSGLSLKEWEPGYGYGWFSDLTHLPALASMLICFPLMFICVSSIPYLDDHVIKRFKANQYGNCRTNRWYVWYNPRVFVRE